MCFSLSFAASDSSTLKGQIFGIIAGIRVQWPMPDPDGCHASNITCPVSGGKVYTYVSTLGGPKGAPKVSSLLDAPREPVKVCKYI